MGNYCSVKEQRSPAIKKIVKKISEYSNSTTASKLDSVESMKKHSHKLLKFLQSENEVDLNLSNKSIEEVEVLSQLGKGGQAKVFQIVLKSTSVSQENNENSHQMIAVKRTNLVKQKNNMESLQLAKRLLNQKQCPFIVDYLFTFSCEKYLYSAMPIAEGGDLTSFLEKWRGKGDAFRKLQETGIRFVLAGIVLGLQFLHSRGFIYCDLKTDNVLIDKFGYPLLSDFDLMSNNKQIPLQQFHSTITSVGPQIHTFFKVDKGIDLWALGILIHFLAYSFMPYTPQQIQHPDFVVKCQKMQGQYKSTKKQVSKQLFCLINSLLKVNPKERIGYQSLEQIRNHDFFRGFQWEKYSNREIQSPLVDIIKQFPIKSQTSRPKGLKLKHKFLIKRQRKYTL